MKKNTLYLFILLLITGLNTSCNYLDIVPDETATEKDAFANPRAALRYLYSCYGYLPQSNMVSSCMDFTGDETISPFSESYVKFAEGSYDSSNTIISYWNTLFQGIRQCYLLKENINSVPKISQDEIDLYTAEADFLIAYFHLLLIKCYGPTILVKELPALDTPADNMLGRRPYDECIDWVADLLDDAATRLPATRNSSDYGRATSVIAKSLKARMLLYAASPLFNGNPDYADFKNPDGEQLMPTTYSEEKYKRAADATWEAIQAALGAGHELYKASTTSNAYPEPTNLTERTLRMTFMDSENFKEVIFPETRKAGAYGIQRKSIPFFPRGSWNGIAPTITMIDRFYTANGLPIDEDPAFSTSNKLDVVTIPEGITYAEPGKRTLYMNMNREPRFYAWIAFENGYYECRTDDKRYAYHKFWGAERSEGDKWLTGFLATENCGVRADDGKIVTAARSQNYSKTGYLISKMTDHSLNHKNNEFGRFSWPICRLGEIYLNYAEALNEYDPGNDDILKYVNLIRQRAGIPNLEEVYPEEVKDPVKMRQLIRRERQIELAFEGYRFFDTRTWRIAEETENGPVYGMNIMATDHTPTGKFWERTIAETRVFNKKHYLFPIAQEELDRNKAITQNYLW